MAVAVRRWMPALRVAFLLVALAAAAWVVIAEWPHLRDLFSHANASYVWAAATVALVAQVVSVAVWRAALRGTTPGSSLATALHSYGVGHLAKFVPGGIWGPVAQVDSVRAGGTSLARASGTVVMFAALSAATAVGVAGLAYARWWSVPPGVLVLALLLWRPALPVLIAGRLIRRVRGAAVDAAPLRWTVVLMCVLWGVLGLHLWLIVQALPDVGEVSFALACAAYAVSWVIGFVVVVAPAGIGVRESVIVATLAGTVGAQAALAAAIAARVLQTFAEIAAAGIALAMSARARRSSRVT